MSFKDSFCARTIGLMVIAIALGVFLRFTHLETRISTPDEVFTALRVSGYTEVDLVTDLSTSVRPVNLKYLQLLSWAKQQTAFQLNETPLLPNQMSKLIRLDRIRQQ